MKLGYFVQKAFAIMGECLFTLVLSLQIYYIYLIAF